VTKLYEIVIGLYYFPFIVHLTEVCQTGYAISPESFDVHTMKIRILLHI